MSLEILLEAALFLERQSQGEEPKNCVNLGQQRSEESENVETKLSAAVGAANGASRRDCASNPGNGYNSSLSSLVKNPVVTASSSPVSRLSPYVNGSNNAVATLYSYNEESVRSPSPTRVYYNGTTGIRDLASPPLHVSNGNSASSSVSQQSYQLSPKVPDSDYTPQPHQVPLSNVYRLDDLASRSHRLEEALLRASHKSPTSTLSSSSQYSQNLSRLSATDELQELKKRGGAGTREVHNKLEKNRRAHLRECFEFLRKQLPAVDDKKLSNLGILKSALRYIQMLKRKEREYEHTMERLAREKIAAQQRLAALRKEVSSIPGYSSDPGLMDLGSVLPVLQHQHIPGERESTLTFANVQAHNIREENKLASLGKSAYQQQEDQEDKESNSTSTASEQGDVSDHDDRNFQETYHRTPAPIYSQAVNGLVVSPVPASYSESRGIKRPYSEEDRSPKLPKEDSSRPHIKYVRTSTPGVAVSASVTGAQPTFLTMASPASILELSNSSSSSNTGQSDNKEVTVERSSSASLFVRQPIAFATAATGGNGLSAHVQLTPQVITTHPGVQLLGPSLKVLAPPAMTGVQVISADVPSSLQSLVAVHPTSSISGKTSEEVPTPLLNGTAATTAGFCIPAGVVIPSLVAIPPEPCSSPTANATSYEMSRNSQRHMKNPSGNNPTSLTEGVLSLSNGLLKGSVNRAVPLQPSTTAGVTHVVTPIGVSRSLPLVTSMAVVPSSKHVAHILTNPGLEKVVTAPLLKAGTIPIIGGQYLTPSSLGARHIIKPLVVVAAPPATPATAAASASVTENAPSRDGGSNHTPPPQPKTPPS